MLLDKFVGQPGGQRIHQLPACPGSPGGQQLLGHQFGEPGAEGVLHVDHPGHRLDRQLGAGQYRCPVDGRRVGGELGPSLRVVHLDHVAGSYFVPVPGRDPGFQFEGELGLGPGLGHAAQFEHPGHVFAIVVPYLGVLGQPVVFLIG